MKPLRETYKGRKLLVKRSATWGLIESYVNGELLGKTPGVTPEAMQREMDSLWHWVDAADERRKTDPDAFPPHWYIGAVSAPEGSKTR